MSTRRTLLDKHAKANAALTNDVSKRIGRILGLRPNTSAKCLDCHSLSAQPEQQTRSFDSHDGISCESCHGPASNWLGPHTTKGWTHPRSIELGMVDVRDPIKCTETCLSCHLGTASKWVDHEMIAAGHPDLYFELDSFLAAMPKHWKPSEDDPWAEVRFLTAGAAVQLRENMRRIARETIGPNTPNSTVSPATTIFHRQKVAGGRNAGTQGGVQAIHRGTDRGTLS